MFTCGITVQVRHGRSPVYMPDAHLGYVPRRLPRPWVPGVVDGGDICAHPKAGAQRRIARAREQSRSRSAFTRVSARAVLPLAAVGGLAALSLAVPAAGVSAVTAVTDKPAAHAVPDVTGPVLKSAQFPAPQTI